MIRPFTFSDMDRILQIEVQSFPKSPYDWATFVNLHHLYRETFLVYLAPAEDFQKDQILGYLVFSKDVHIISIAVDPSHRRRGVGKKLLERAMAEPAIKRLWAEVRRSNQVAQAFYFSMGFRIIGLVPNYYGNEDALIVQWTPSLRSP